MRQTLLMLFLLLLWTLPIKRVHVQPITVYNQCDADYVAEITGVSDDVNYAAGCQTYSTCIEQGVNASMCQMRAQLELEKSCQQTGDSCRTLAALYAAAITIADEESSYNFPKGSEYIHNDIPGIFSNLAEGDVMGALGSYIDIQPYLPASPMIPLSIGAIYERVNLPDQAAEAYTQALAINANIPLVYYMRAHAYEKSGQSQQSSLDYQTLATYLEDDPVLSTLANTLKAVSPSETEAFEDWLVYPVTSHSSSPGGEIYRDWMTTEPEPVRLLFSEDARQLAFNASGETETLNYFAGLPGVTSLSLSHPGIYQTTVVTESGSEVTITLDFSGTEPVQGWIQRIGSESLSTLYFVLTTGEQTDPRDSFGLPHCEGAATSRLNMGQKGKVHRGMGWTLPIYETPGDAQAIGEIKNSHLVNIVEGPECQDGIAWWKIEDNGGLIGWVQESENQEYWLYPDNKRTIPVSCPDTLLSRLNPGDSGRVIPGPGANRVRNQPALNGTVTGTLPEDSYFTVISGPVCADGYAWWQIDGNGLTGWTAEGEKEGEKETYWIEPA